MPALLTSTSTCPATSRARAVSRSRSASTVTSHRPRPCPAARRPAPRAGRPGGRPPRPARRPRAAPGRSADRARHEAPVTMATRPSSRNAATGEVEVRVHPDMMTGSVAFVKIRIGYGLGTRTVTNDGDAFGAFVDDLERLGFDSLWLSERISGEAPDPLIALSYAAARTTKLKFGMSVLVLPGPQPGPAGRGAGHARPALGRPPAPGVRARRGRSPRAAGLRRRAGRPGQDLQRVAAAAAPPLDRGRASTTTARGSTTRASGSAPSPCSSRSSCGSAASRRASCERVGRLGDGWLPSFCTAADVAAAIPVIVETADAHDRAIDPEHYGALVAYSRRRDPRRAGRASSPTAAPISTIRRSSSRSACRRCGPASRRWSTPGVEVRGAAALRADHGRLARRARSRRRRAQAAGERDRLDGSRSTTRTSRPARRWPARTNSSSRSGSPTSSHASTLSLR